MCFLGRKPKVDNKPPVAISEMVSEAAERVDLMHQEFENEGFVSTALKTWTPPKTCGRKLARFNRRLCLKMKDEFKRLQKVKLLEKDDGAASPAVEACDPLGKGDEELRDDVKGCFAKASVSVDMQESNVSVKIQNISDSVETPPPKCGMEKTEAFGEAKVALVEPFA